MATYVNVLYMPVPRALANPTPQQVREVLSNPYSEGFDGVFPRLQKAAAEQTLSEICGTFAATIRTTAHRLGLQPHELTLGQVARAIVGRPAIDPLRSN